MTDRADFLGERRDARGLAQRGRAATEVERLQRLRAFFGGDYQSRTFANEQRFDFAGLRGRLLSSSYVPAADDPGREPMLAELRRLFDRHAEAGQVRVLYETELYFGRLSR